MIIQQRLNCYILSSLKQSLRTIGTRSQRSNQNLLLNVLTGFDF
ncbi:hypothetical protein SLEP1_g30759 [Rubroshorea leprosula]|uniref:Uncharacterized protein n=1 Tax=Rubroshorea leprosula TaxID=152421 RepID=A0AAV5K713_9ROSI|nr:hypothetical protein SLEP1_g30759 [Rubroshorea leprosula]